ncbi:hypothetical protein [Phenylobacterium sp.]|uniref:hypothetical protein n=1 Tax=Phenylobacterium sp. TaxID=1871053 RepID=UPI00121E2D14|nr:hypothetical protein [Phenylobacterium sp.]THD71499.1 MAG: hypothetical protein E8A12_01475 [Phenylobacterium sp.]
MRISVLLCAAIATASAAGAAQSADLTPAPYRAPRNAQGEPDLQGVWNNTALTFLQRPPIFKALAATDKEEAMMIAGFKQFAGDIISSAPIDPKLGPPPVVKEAPQSDFLEMDLHLGRVGGERRSSWIVDPVNGRLPFTDAGKKADKAAEDDSFEGPETRPTSERCLTAVGSPEGPPMMNTGFNGNYQIVQAPGFVAIHIEMNHDVRIIRMLDRAHLPDAIHPWLGDSVGWWEGDTLVVETTNLSPKAPVSSLGGGFVFSSHAKLTERFTRTAQDRILYEFAVDDPVNFTQVWRAQLPMRAAKGPIYEYACHEGNYSLPNALSGARAEERMKSPVAPPPAP